MEGTGSSRPQEVNADHIRSEDDLPVDDTDKIRPVGYRLDSGIYKFPKTKKSLMARLSRTFSRKSEPVLPPIVVKHKDRYLKLKKKGKFDQAAQEHALYKKTFALAKENQALVQELSSVNISRRRMKASRTKLMKGKYGPVFMVSIKLKNAVPKKQCVQFAAKTLSAGSTLEQQQHFLREMVLMNRLDHHPNVVDYIGCSIGKEPYYSVLGFATHGTLLSLLLTLTKTFAAEKIDWNIFPGFKDMTPDKMLAFQHACVKDIARGMEYLSSEKIVHCDLGCHNILLDNRYICKITDFYYAIDGKGQLKTNDLLDVNHGSIRHKAVESLAYNVYSSQSDVWAFGILMWEVFAYGEKPYYSVKKKDVKETVLNGVRLPKPIPFSEEAQCSDEIYQLMKSCWALDPNRRPTFKKLLAIFQKMNISSFLKDDE